jgi:hypothetical protein
MAIAGIIIVLLLTGLVGVLVAGVVLMGVGGKTNEKYSNKLMVARVWLQGLLVVMLALMFMTGGMHVK